MQVIGFDPGGVGRFGWCVIRFGRGDPVVRAHGTCDGAGTALDQAATHCPDPPEAVAVDAPLYWILEGDRRADQHVRRLVREAGGQSSTVSHVNSLRGACLVQGIQVARLAKKRWLNAKITEAHPKALMAVCAAARSFVHKFASAAVTEHERDALLAGYAAHRFSRASEGWKDLVALDAEPFFPTGERVAYWFPETRT